MSRVDLDHGTQFALKDEVQVQSKLQVFSWFYWVFLDCVGIQACMRLLAKYNWNR